MPPLRRSALHHRLVASGARMRSLNGWECAVSFGNPAAESRALRGTVVLADVSARFVVLAQSEMLEEWLPFAPEVGRSAVVTNGGSPVRCCRLTRVSALFLSTQPAELPLPPREGCAHRTDLTCGRTALLVGGPQSRDLLRSLTQLDVREKAMPDGGCAQTSLARVPATILRHDRAGAPAYEVLVPRDLGEYVWEALLDAGSVLGAQLVGLTALGMGD